MSRFPPFHSPSPFVFKDFQFPLLFPVCVCVCVLCVCETEKEEKGGMNWGSCVGRMD